MCTYIHKDTYINTITYTNIIAKIITVDLEKKNVKKKNVNVIRQKK